MLSRSLPRSRSGSRDGVALVIVLAFIVLTSILIVSFIAFSSSNRLATASYAKTIQAQEIAQGGLQDIINDLHQEIAAGSSAYTNNNTVIYVPTTNYTAQPTRLGYDSSLYTNDVSSAFLPPTLVRVSRASQDGTPADLYPPLTNSYFTTGATPANRASAANSSANSYNGHYISASRWNKISLLSTNSTIPPPFATNTPDWVYVTRGGSRACTTNDLTSATASILPSNNLESTTAVVGRYAYVIYDEGALLDINAAGYISNATNNFARLTNAPGTTAPTNSYTPAITSNFSGATQITTGKTYTAYADLTQLPGLNTTGGQTNIDNFIKWRNAANLASSSTGTNYYRTAFNYATNGFTAFQNGDSPLVSRRDLINYISKIDPNRTTLGQALPYLGTFSRAANAPSWYPTANSPGLPGYYGLTSAVTGTAFTTANFANINYKDNAEISGTANRDIPNVRVANAGNMTHYNDDGTSYSYPVQVGDPLIQHRFSLAKLAWLTRTGPATGITDAAIQACFGLKWEAEDWSGTTTPPHPDRWDYVAATSGTSPQIETLDQVASEGREPNFFELLRAGILSGSIGQSPGPVVSDSTSDGVMGFNFDSYSTSKTRHLLQIGANIIDQADSDSVPTAIYLANMFTVPSPASLSNEADLAENTVYGDENLPGLMCLDFVMIEDYYDNKTDPLNPKGYLKSWTYPEIWNIHQTPATGVDQTVTGASGYPHPTQFRIHAFGEVAVQFVQNGHTVTGFGTGLTLSANYDSTATYTTHSYKDGTEQDIPGSATTVTGAVPAATTTTPFNLVYFQDYGSAVSPFYRYPEYLQFQNLYSSFSGQKISFFNGTPSLNLSSYNPDAPVYYNDFNIPSDMNGTTWNGNAFAAIFEGEYTLPDMSTGSGLNIQINLTITSPFSLCIECQDPKTNKWHPYNFISSLKSWQGTSGTVSYSIMGDNSNGVTSNWVGTPGGTTASDHAANGITNQGASSRGGCLARPDPRTDRFSVFKSRTQQSGPRVNSTFEPVPGSSGTYHIEDNWPKRTWGFVYNPDASSGFSTGPGGWVSDWAYNTTSSRAFYVDPDGVVRPGDSYRANMTSGDGWMQYHGAGTSTPSTADTITIGTTPASLVPTTVSSANSSIPLGSGQARRPVILNRPFRNVGELGYAYRDLPFKSLDFFTTTSGDAALLDLFCVSDEPSTTAGQVNLSNAPASIWTSIMSGTSKMEVNNSANNSQSWGTINATTGAPNFMTPADALAAATAGTFFLNQNGPLTNRADLVTKLSDTFFNSLYSSTASNPNINYANKVYAEAPVRALSNVASTRTWNLLIDIIAQSGQMSPTAQTMNDFVVQGEHRYWLHVAIDRYTGKIVDQQLEPVYD